MAKFTRFKHPPAFMDVAGDALRQDEALHSLVLGIATRLVGKTNYYGPDPFLGVVKDDGEVVLVSMMTPPYGLLLAPIQHKLGNAFNLLADALQDEGWKLPDVQGAKPEAGQFASIWAERSGCTAELEMAQRLYVLRQVIMPQGIPGTFIQARAEHAPLIAEWLYAFEIDCFGETHFTKERYRTQAETQVEAGAWHLWEVDGQVVSMAIASRPSEHGIGVSGVYTPPEHRRKGYATACVAATSHKMLDQGYQFTNLFTDLANPTSNSIYMKIGYQPIRDFDKYKFIY